MKYIPLVITSKTDDAFMLKIVSEEASRVCITGQTWRMTFKVGAMLRLEYFRNFTQTFFFVLNETVIQMTDRNNQKNKQTKKASLCYIQLGERHIRYLSPC